MYFDGRSRPAGFTFRRSTAGMPQSVGGSVEGPITIYDVLASTATRQEVLRRLRHEDFAEDFLLPGDEALTVGGSHSQGGLVLTLTSGEAVFVKRSDRHAVHRDV